MSVLALCHELDHEGLASILAHEAGLARARGNHLHADVLQRIARDPRAAHDFSVWSELKRNGGEQHARSVFCLADSTLEKLGDVYVHEHCPDPFECSDCTTLRACCREHAAIEDEWPLIQTWDCYHCGETYGIDDEHAAGYELRMVDYVPRERKPVCKRCLAEVQA